MQEGGRDVTDIADRETSRAETQAKARRPASPALLAGLALMPLVIAAGLLRERLDAPPVPELRPTLAACAAGADCPARAAPVSLAGADAPGGAGSSMVRAGRS